MVSPGFWAFILPVIKARLKRNAIAILGSFGIILNKKLIIGYISKVAPSISLSKWEFPRGSSRGCKEHIRIIMTYYS
jgi:hypothetical protein